MSSKTEVSKGKKNTKFNLVRQLSKLSDQSDKLIKNNLGIGLQKANSAEQPNTLDRDKDSDAESLSLSDEEIQQKQQMFEGLLDPQSKLTKKQRHASRVVNQNIIKKDTRLSGIAEQSFEYMESRSTFDVERILGQQANLPSDKSLSDTEMINQ